MAERRMLSSKIICSDAFTEMPFSAQALYLQLVMEADDDGFLNNARRIQRTIEATQADLDILLEKRYLLGFENCIVVIKHWRIHNQIRKDRYNPTHYQDEFNKLEIKPDGAYTEKKCCDHGTNPATTWQPNGNQMAPQVRLGKDSIVQDSIEEGEQHDSDESAPPPVHIDFDSEKVIKAMADAEKEVVTCQQIVDLYHSICKSFPKIRTLSEARKKAIKARIKTYSIKDFQTVFESAEASAFLKGANDRNWTADFDWLIKDANMAKVLEGKYADKPKRYGRKEPVPGWMPFTMGDAEKEAIQRLLAEDQTESVETNPEIAAEADELAQRMQEKYGKKEVG